MAADYLFRARRKEIVAKLENTKIYVFLNLKNLICIFHSS
jgi:hypothetical protein